MEIALWSRKFAKMPVNLFKNSSSKGSVNDQSKRIFYYQVIVDDIDRVHTHGGFRNQAQNFNLLLRRYFNSFCNCFSNSKVEMVTFSNC